ncbi:MAG: PTS transporter subunit EIIC [Clostridiales bacterium]|nr:PTS transporter subunit EIIC [Clostridiales bacterium]
MDYGTIAKQILDAVGGVDNITFLGNCMTRLRFTLRDKSKIDEQSIHSINVVKGMTRSGGQFQVIIGPEVSEICEEMQKIGGFQATKGDKTKKIVIWDIFVETLSDTMIPIIGVIIGAAMLNVIAAIAQMFGIDTSGGTWSFISQMADISFYFLPVFVGYSAAKKMGANVLYGIFIGLALVYPPLAETIAGDGGLSLFGFTLPVFTYTYTVIPVILAVILVKYVERLAKRIIPKVISIFGVPMFVFLVCVPITFLVLGPIGNWLGNLVSTLVIYLSENFGMLAVAILALLLPYIIMTGMHSATIVPIFITHIASYGFDSVFLPAFMACNIATAGAAFAVAIRTKNSKIKQLGFSSGVSSMCGIIEPSLFGICFRFRKPLYAVMGGSAIAGIVSYFVNYKVYIPVPQSVFALPAAADGAGNIVSAIIVFAVALVASFVLTWILGFEDIEENGQDKKKLA